MNKSCKNCQQSFKITPDDQAFYAKMGVPEPTRCWRCRAMRRMAWRNMTHLYKRTCDATGKDFFTLMPQSAPMPVYHHDYWVSDAWSPLDYGTTYDSSRSFFEQWRELFHRVPWAPMWNHHKINSDYSISAYIKDCYLCFDTGNNTEDSAYCVSVQFGKRCFNLINCKHCEMCYFCINTDQSFKTFFSRNCVSCTDSWFLQDCIGCTSCFGCTGLRNKSYCIDNEQYSKEGYKKKLDELLGDFEGAKKQAMKTWLKYPVKYMHGFQNKNVTGDYIFNSADLRMCFFANGAQNCAYSQSIIYTPIKDSMDITSVGQNVELDYEVLCAGRDLSEVMFAFDCGSVRNSEYVTSCRDSAYLFGCVGLRKTKYCILNKQYSPEAYKKLCTQIIADMKKRGEYGEFFPAEMSPFGYNETQAMDYFPLTKEEAIRQGFKWRDQKRKEVPKAEGVIKCEHDQNCDHLCTGGFKMLEREKDFCNRMRIPYPTLCFNCRYKELVSWRNAPALYERKCAKCGRNIETSYALGRPEIVYCESCYNKEIA